MKKILYLSVFFLLISQLVVSQRYAYVDTEYVLNKLPSYTTAQSKLDGFSKTWQKEVEDKFAEVERKYKEYQNEKVLLSEDMKKAKEEEIIKLERSAKELKNKYFGVSGELFKKREELIKPIQEEIYNALKQIAEDGNYAMIFDVAAGAYILYTDDKYDVSDDVLKKISF
jgi:outer membrane protein